MSHVGWWTESWIHLLVGSRTGLQMLQHNVWLVPEQAFQRIFRFVKIVCQLAMLNIQTD